MQLTKNILLAFMPLSAWICLFLSIPFFILPAIADTPYRFIGFLLLNYFVFRLSTPLIIVLHELGHWIAARMVGEYPARIVLGNGHLLLRTTFFSTKVNLYSKIYSGYIFCIFKNNRNIIPRHLIYILGGPFINIIVGLLIIYTVPYTWSFRDHIAISLFFGYLQVFIGLASLYPNVSKTNGFPMYSDGLHIWKIIRGTYDGNITEVALNHFFEGEDYFHSKSYDKALEEYQYGLQAAQSLNDRDKSAVLINIAACYLQMEQFEKTFQILG